MNKTEWATPIITFLGILLNGNTFTLSIPVEKRLKAQNLLMHAIQKRKVTIHFIQKLTGTLNFLNKAIIPGRTFTRAMYTKLKLRDSRNRLLKQYHHVNLDATFIADCKMWMKFLDRADQVHLCRPFVDVNDLRFVTTLHFYSDSSLNKNFGMGAIFDN